MAACSLKSRTSERNPVEIYHTGEWFGLMDGIEAVVFDLDDTLCVSTQDDEDIHEAIFEQVGVEPFFEPTDLYSIDYASLPETDSDREHYAHMYRAAVEQAGTDPDRSLIEELAEATINVLDPAAVAFNDGAEAAFEYVRGHYRVGLLTNGSEQTQAAKLDSLGIRDAFDAVVFCGPGTGFPSKPDPEPFRHLLDELGVAPESAVYVGDRHDGDVIGAHNAGMHSVLVAPDGDPSDPDPSPSHRLETLDELTEVL